MVEMGISMVPAHSILRVRDLVKVAAFAFHRAPFLNVHKIRADSDNKR